MMVVRFMTRTQHPTTKTFYWTEDRSLKDRQTYYLIKYYIRSKYFLPIMVVSVMTPRRTDVAIEMIVNS